MHQTYTKCTKNIPNAQKYTAGPKNVLKGPQNRYMCISNCHKIYQTAKNISKVSVQRLFKICPNCHIWHENLATPLARLAAKTSRRKFDNNYFHLFLIQLVFGCSAVLCVKAWWQMMA
jgi:hypothetical protein